MEHIDSTMRIRLWFETDKKMLFGLGRVMLLKKVEEHGSLNKAAKELGMSYRAAWGKIKATEKELGVELLTKAPGAKQYSLSENGQKLLECFDKWRSEIEIIALEKAQDMFPWQTRGFEESNVDETS